MKILSAIVYGLIQGLTEFLPVSSSGHLAIAHGIFGTSTADNFTFDILLHLATLIAVFIVYYKDIFPLVPAFFRMVGKIFKGKFKLKELDKNERLALLVIIATLPLAIAVLINDKVELLSAYPKLVGGILIFNGIVLFVSDLLPKSNVEVQTATPLNALTVGLCQLCAIVPGLSRSGSTITGGRLCGFSREFAVKFSFILSIPAIIGANIFNIPDVIKNPPPLSDIPAYLIGMTVAAVVGVLAMKLLNYMSKKSNFRIFSVYCIIVGIVALIFA
jgi:undecaprenyl-diphosphatase